MACFEERFRALVGALLALWGVLKERERDEDVVWGDLDIGGRGACG